MTWYIIKLIFRIRTETGNNTQFDEQIRMIHASGDEEALMKARLTGVRNEDDPDNSHTATKWEFIDVAELMAVPIFADGMELYSRIHETEDEENYLQYIKSRSQQIETRITPTRKALTAIGN